MKRGSLLMMMLGVALYPGSLKAQWVETDGPYSSYGGTASSLLSIGPDVFAGTFQDGVFLSTDKGVTWTPVSTGMINGSVNCMALSGTDIFAGTDNGIYMSSNRGTSWSGVGAGGVVFYVESIAATDTTVFAGSSTGISILTRHPDDSWSAVYKNLAYITALEIVGNSIYAGTFGDGLLVSTDNGNTWASKDSGLTRSYVYSLGRSGSCLFAGTDSGAFVSRDGGTSWTPVASGLPKVSISCFDTNATSLFAATSRGVYQSTDGGFQWSAANQGLANTQVSSLAVDGDHLIAGVLGHIFVSTDNGSSWTASETPFERSSIAPLTSDGGLLYGADGFTFYTSSDSGSSWVRTVDGTTIPYQFHVLTARGRYVLAGLENNVSLRSTDYGTTWTDMKSAGGSLSAGSFAWLGSDVFCGGNGGVFVSTDSGASWSSVGLSSQGVGAVTSQGEDLFAATAYNIFRSTNSGANWSQLKIDYPSYDAQYFGIAALAATSRSVFAGTSLGVFQLEESSDTFENILPSNTGWTAQTIAVSDSDLFVIADGQIIHLSDSGTDWGSVDDGLMFQPRSLTISGQYLYAGTYKGGVWKRPLSQVIAGVAPTGGSLPEKFELYQNYPNPFNPSTKISYQLPTASEVTLTIYDVLGRQVKTLVRERQTAGNYSVMFNATDLPSGVYFYRLEAGTYHDTKKLLLLK